MESAGLAQAFSRDGKVCVDPGSEHDFQDPVLPKWRADLQAHFPATTVTFKSPADSLAFDDGSWEPAGEFYTPTGLKDLVERENENARQLLVAQLRSPMGVVPFVGAGFSVDFGFPGWPKFLSEAADFHSDPRAVRELVRQNKLIEAASRLAESPDRFQLLVEKSFGRPVSEEQARRGAVSYLPMLASGPVITTNFDRVLETAFQAAGAPFEEFITGDEADNVIRAMHRNKHVLIKMHGDALDRSARVFTGFEYDRGYTTISKLARIMFTNRPLLFLGSSLEKDRTLEVLEQIHKELPGLIHYAVLSASWSVSGLRKRRGELDNFGIIPLWFLPGDYRNIESILAELIQEASTRLVWKPKIAVASQTPPPAPPPAAPSAPAVLPPNVDETLTVLARRLARRIVNGRIAFFLGAGAHVGGQMTARAFYRSIAMEHAIDETELQRAEAAQFLIDHEGRAEAWNAARERLPTDAAQASVVFRFLAELPGMLRAHGRESSSAQWMLTTNYDIMLEKVYRNAGEAFHLLYYQVDGKDAGSFLHREPDGTIRVIEQPRHVVSFREGAHLIAKLDGGEPYDPHFNETVAFSPMDFAISAGRLPNALPEAVRSVLTERSLLVLGSSLKDPHVQSLVRWSAGAARGTKTWAIALNWTETDKRFWLAAGVELVNCDFEVFIPVLRSEVLRALASQPGAGSL